MLLRPEGILKKQLAFLSLFSFFVMFLIGCSLFPTTTTTTASTTTTTASTTTTTDSTTSSMPTSQSATTSATVTTTSLPTSGTSTITTTTTTSGLTSTTTTTTTTTTTSSTLLSVQFDAQGGLYQPAIQQIELGGIAIAPQQPIKVGFRFDGWVRSLESTTKWDFQSDLVLEPTTLYATWVPVVFDDNAYLPGVEVTETFTSLSQSGSSYTSFSYTGVQGLIWTVSGARGDIALDGKAILLAGKADFSSLKATLPDGINALQFQAKRGFTNINPRQIEVFMNGVSQGVFTIDPVSDAVQTFTLSNLAISGPVVLEFIHITGIEARAQVLIDNIVWTTFAGSSKPINQQKVENDAESLDLITTYFHPQAIVLPAFGSYGSTITWTYDNPGNANNGLINLQGPAVNVPLEGIAEISLRATFTAGEFQATRVFLYRLGIPGPATLSEASVAANGSTIKTQGVIHAFYQNGDMYDVFFEDSSGGLLVRVPLAYASQIVIGNEIRFEGIKQAINQMPYLDQITMFEFLRTTSASNAILVDDPFDLSGLVGRSVSIRGLLASNYPESSVAYEIVRPEGVFEVRLPGGLDQASRIAIQNAFANSGAGDETILTGVVVRNNATYSIQLFLPALQNLSTDTDPVLLTAILNESLSLSLPAQTTQNLTLPGASVLPFGATIVWTSSHPDVLSTSGLVTQGNQAINVTLAYTIRIGASVVMQESAIILILARSAYTGYYASINGLTGAALKTELTRIVSTGMITIGYSNTSYILDETDADPARPGNILLVYNRASVSGVWDGASTWNKEHVWPQSKLGTASDSDLHNLRPSNPSINSNRGNLAFVAGSGTYGARSGGWFPGEDDKGDIARIVFYMNTRWGLAIDANIGNLATFIEWHTTDPVDAFEINRNNQIYLNQNNRNPYIDHPELVGVVYGVYQAPVSANPASDSTGWIVWIRLQATTPLWQSSRRNQANSFIQ
jgi:endonuclease I